MKHPVKQTALTLLGITVIISEFMRDADNAKPAFSLERLATTSMKYGNACAGIGKY